MRRKSESSNIDQDSFSGFNENQYEENMSFSVILRIQSLRVEDKFLDANSIIQEWRI